MTKTISAMMAGLMLLAPGPATAAVPAAPTQQAAKVSNRIPNTTTKLVNGSALVGTRCTGEFPDYDYSMSFFERPSSICVRWDNREPVVSAMWELWKDKPGPSDEKIASGDLPAAALSGGNHATFNISLGKLPKHNESKANQKYFVRIVAKHKAGDTRSQISSRGTLVHRPKSAEPKAQPTDPYKCSAAPDNYARTVQLTLPKMTVNQTTSTAGDADREAAWAWCSSPATFISIVPSP